jgi:hypothetical protein
MINQKIALDKITQARGVKTWVIFGSAGEVIEKAADAFGDAFAPIFPIMHELGCCPYPRDSTGNASGFNQIMAVFEECSALGVPFENSGWFWVVTNSSANLGSLRFAMKRCLSQVTMNEPNATQV